MAVVMTLNGITFNDQTPDANGATWYITDEVDGWDSPSLRQSFLDRTARDGQALGESLLSGRTLVLKGFCKAPSLAAYWLSRDVLASATNLLSSTGVFTMAETVTKRCNVYRSQPLKMTNSGGSTFKFQISLYAPDPLKYGVAHATALAAGNTVINNAGNYPVYPSITMTAAGTSSRFKNTTIPGNPEVFLRTGQTLANGDILDMNARTLTSGGGSIYDRMDVSGTWWPLQPGNNTINLTNMATATINYRDAWL